MKIFHLWNTAGVGSVIAKFMDRMFNTDSFVVIRSNYDPYGLTVYGELWNDRAKIFTLKCLWKIKDYDIVHVHGYSDIIPILKKLYPKKPVVVHYHGDDIRKKWRLKKQLWSKADLILYSTLDLYDKETPENAIYIPNPVDTDFFHPRPIRKYDNKLSILIASGSWKEKGTDMAIRALSQLKDITQASIIQHGVDYSHMMNLAKSLDLDITQYPKIPYPKISEFFWNFDLIFDQFKCGVMGKIFLEAVISGRPALGYLSSKYREFNSLPMKDIDSSEKIVKAIEELDDLANLWEAQHEYVKTEHNVNIIVEKIYELYKEL